MFLMLTVRASQMKVFEDIRRRDFEEAVFRRVSLKYPDEYAHLTESGLRDLVGRSIARAVRYELVKEVHVARFVELTIEFGENFERSPQSSVAAQQLLEHPSLPGSAKLQGVHDLLTGASGGRTIRVCR